MDERQFDEVTRLAAGASRRQALRALGGSAAGGLLALFGGRRTQAQVSGPDCCPPDKPRRQGLQQSLTEIAGVSSCHSRTVPHRQLT